MKLPSKSQARALKFYIDNGHDGTAHAESLAAYRGTDRFSYLNHERTIDSLKRHGWVSEDDKITEAGLSALIEFTSLNGKVST